MKDELIEEKRACENKAEHLWVQLVEVKKRWNLLWHFFSECTLFAIRNSFFVFNSTMSFSDGWIMRSTRQNKIWSWGWRILCECQTKIIFVKKFIEMFIHYWNKNWNIVWQCLQGYNSRRGTLRRSIAKNSGVEIRRRRLIQEQGSWTGQSHPHLQENHGSRVSWKVIYAVVFRVSQFVPYWFNCVRKLK